MGTNPIPEGYHSVTPYLVVDNAAEAIRFYEQAFGAKEKFRMPMGDRIGHAELVIGDSHVMLADEFPEAGHVSPKSLGGTSVSLMVYVPDVDTTFQQALNAGATQKRAVEDQFWGDRMGGLVDPFGHEWSLATHVEEVPPQEIQRRLEQMSSHKQSEPA